MTKTIKETWKEEIYEIITHNETSECHSKLVALVESLISEVEALARRETVEEVVKNFHEVQERYPEFALDLELFEGDILVNTTKYERVKLTT